MFFQNISSSSSSSSQESEEEDILLNIVGVSELLRAQPKNELFLEDTVQLYNEEEFKTHFR